MGLICQYDAHRLDNFILSIIQSISLILGFRYRVYEQLFVTFLCKAWQILKLFPHKLFECSIVWSIFNWLWLIEPIIMILKMMRFEKVDYIWKWTSTSGSSLKYITHLHFFCKQEPVSDRGYPHVILYHIRHILWHLKHQQ